MRKTLAVCLLLVFCCLTFTPPNAAAQSQPQWVVVTSVVLFDQTGPIAPTTAFTPAQNGMYRLSCVMTGSPEADQVFRLNFQLVSGRHFNLSCQPGGIPLVYLFLPAAGTPVVYQVTGSKGTYNIGFTIEQLQNTN
jgi:hypothetical protein